MPKIIIKITEHHSMTTYERIRKRAATLDISIAQVCREAGVNRDTLNHWRLKEPQSFQILARIEAVLAKHEAEANTDNHGPDADA